MFGRKLLTEKELETIKKIAEKLKKMEDKKWK